MKAFVIVVMSMIALAGVAGPGAAAQPMPQRCIGQWAGTMYIYQQGRLADSVAIRFSVAPLAPDSSRLQWRMQYVHATRPPLTKDYVLQQLGPGQYQTDEGNGIMLHDYLVGAKLYSQFETGGYQLTASYELLPGGQELLFEVTSGQALPGPADSPVKSIAVTSVQRVLLRRQ